jgi:hypothetical protein
MRFRSYQCWFPKEVDAPREYEDASALSEKAGRAVVADGVSSAIFSRAWARLLTRTAVTSPPDTTSSEAMLDWLLPLQQEWRQAIGYEAVARDWIRGPKVRSLGGQATLLIVEIEPIQGADDAGASAMAGDEYRLVGHAVGDCCLFLIRGGEKILSFPMTNSEAYAAGPQVVSSIAKNVEYADRFEHLEDRCRAGDLLVVCTDAIGLWAMQEYEDGNSVDWMRYWENDAAWQDDIVALRARGPKDPGNRMRIDDCTLLLLQVVQEEALADEPDMQPDRSDEPFALLGAADGAAREGSAELPEGPDAGVSETVSASSEGAVEEAVVSPDALTIEAPSDVTVISATPTAAESSDEDVPASDGPDAAASSVDATNPTEPQGIEAVDPSKEPPPSPDHAAVVEPHAGESPNLLQRIFGFGRQT